MDSKLDKRFQGIEQAMRVMGEHLRRARLPIQELLTEAEVADVLRVSRGTVRRMIDSGSLRATRLPLGTKMMAYRIKPSDVEALIDGAKAAQRQREQLARLIRRPRISY